MYPIHQHNVNEQLIVASMPYIHVIADYQDGDVDVDVEDDLCG